MIPSPHIFTLFPYTTLFRSNYRNIGSSCELGDRALLGVAYHHRVDIPTHDTTGVVDGFPLDRKSTRLNSSHVAISYAVFCLQKKNYKRQRAPDQADCVRYRA